MAESLLREIGKGRFNAYSAGSQPKGAIHPKAMELRWRRSWSPDCSGWRSAAPR